MPIVEKEDLKKYVNSDIIFAKNELRLLKDKISDRDKKLHVFFDKLYRATEDGDNADVVKKKCKDILKSLTLFYTEEGARFGFYIQKEEKLGFFGKYFEEKPGTCFLISLNNCCIYDIIEYNSATEYKGDILCFIKNKQKNKNKSKWAVFTPQKNFLGQECILGELYDFFDVDFLSDIIGEKNEYHLKEVEIFEVAIEDEDYNKDNNENNDDNDNENYYDNNEENSNVIKIRINNGKKRRKQSIEEELEKKLTNNHSNNMKEENIKNNISFNSNNSKKNSSKDNINNQDNNSHQNELNENKDNKNINNISFKDNNEIIKEDGNNFFWKRFIKGKGEK